MSKRITDFTALSAGDVSGTELLYVIDPGLSPADRKMTLTVLQTWLATQNWSFSGSIELTGALTLTGLTVTTNGITVTGNSTITGTLGGLTTVSATTFSGTLSGAAPAGSLSGTTLASNVVTSSLTAIGTLASGAVPASLVTAGTFGSGSYTFPGALAITGTLTGVTTLTTSGAINGQTISSAASFTGSLAVGGAVTATGGSVQVSGGSNPFLSLHDGTGYAYVEVVSGVLRLTPRSGQSILLNSAVTADSINGQTISSAASFTGTLAVTGTTALNSTTTVASNTATGVGLTVQCDNVTTGSVGKFVSNNGGAFTGTVLSVINDFNAGQTATALYVRQDDDGKGIVLDMTRFGVGLTINSPSSSGTAISVTGGGSVSFSGALAVSGAVTMTGNVGELSLGNTTTGSYSFMRLYTGSSHKSWQIAVQNTLNDGFEIAASTTNGGVSFSTPVFTITSAGAARMSGYGAGTATFDASGNITSVSDERQKTDIVPFTAGLAELRGIVPIAHKFSADSGLDTEHTYIGFSAQNVREHLPGVVFEHAETGTLSLWDRGLLAATVNAIQSLDQRVTALEAAY